MEFKKLELQDEGSWFKRRISSNHFKKSIIYILIGAALGFIFTGCQKEFLDKASLSDIADDNFKKANVELTTLSNYESLLEQAMDSHYINEKYRTTLSDWRKNPSKWNYTKNESKN